MIEKGGVFIIDEMSARLHPLLTKFIVDMFQSISNKRAQLIFTNHDSSLLNKELFRRDEVLFVDKDLSMIIILVVRNMGRTKLPKGRSVATKNQYLGKIIIFCEGISEKNYIDYFGDIINKNK